MYGFLSKGLCSLSLSDPSFAQLRQFDVYNRVVFVALKYLFKIEAKCGGLSFVKTR